MRTPIDKLTLPSVSSAAIQKLKELHIKTVEQFLGRVSDVGAKDALRKHLGVTEESMQHMIECAKALVNWNDPLPHKVGRGALIPPTSKK